MNTTATVRSVNVADKKGRKKDPAASILIREDWGVEGDAHAGMLVDESHKGWAHRQVSMLAWESIQKAQAAGLAVAEGDFAENITTEGIDLLSLPLGTRVQVGEAELELSQVGKVCHTKCAIYRLMGDCIFPREGIFFVARRGGVVKPGDSIVVLEMGDGACSATPPEALEELRRVNG